MAGDSILATGSVADIGITYYGVIAVMVAIMARQSFCNGVGISAHNSILYDSAR